jgi:hypothetical protein
MKKITTAVLLASFSAIVGLIVLGASDASLSLLS